MRFLVSTFIALTLFIFFIGQSPAQKNGSEKNQRIAQIEKEIRDLQEKISKLATELAELQPPRAVTVVDGMITGGELPYVLDLDNRGIRYFLFNSQVQSMPTSGRQPSPI